MVNLSKLIEQLSSPNADRRYDACEELRVGGESSEAVIDALEKAALDANAHRARREMRG